MGLHLCVHWIHEACEHRCVTNHPMSCGTQVHRVKLACIKTAPDTLLSGHECSDTMCPESSGLSESYVHRVGLFWLHLVKLTCIKTAPNTLLSGYVVWTSLCQIWMFGHDVTKVIRFEWILRASCGTRVCQKTVSDAIVFGSVSDIWVDSNCMKWLRWIWEIKGKGNIVDVLSIITFTCAVEHASKRGERKRTWEMIPHFGDCYKRGK